MRPEFNDGGGEKPGSFLSCRRSIQLSEQTLSQQIFTRGALALTSNEEERTALGEDGLGRGRRCIRCCWCLMHDGDFCGILLLGSRLRQGRGRGKREVGRTSRKACCRGGCVEKQQLCAEQGHAAAGRNGGGDHVSLLDPADSPCAGACSCRFQLTLPQNLTTNRVDFDEKSRP